MDIHVYYVYHVHHVFIFMFIYTYICITYRLFSAWHQKPWNAWDSVLRKHFSPWKKRMFCISCIADQTGSNWLKTCIFSPIIKADPSETLGDLTSNASFTASPWLVNRPKGSNLLSPHADGTQRDDLFLVTKSGWWLSHPIEKYESQLGWWHSQYGKIKFMFQTTNQLNVRAPGQLNTVSSIQLLFQSTTEVPSLARVKQVSPCHPLQLSGNPLRTWQCCSLFLKPEKMSKSLPAARIHNFFSNILVEDGEKVTKTPTTKGV